MSVLVARLLAILAQRGGKDVNSLSLSPPSEESTIILSPGGSTTTESRERPWRPASSRYILEEFCEDPGEVTSATGEFLDHSEADCPYLQ